MEERLHHACFAVDVKATGIIQETACLILELRLELLRPEGFGA